MIKCQSNLKWYNEMKNKVLMYDFKKQNILLFETKTTTIRNDYY